MWYRDYYPRFPKSKPRAAKGGIKAQSKTFGKSWWAKRWIEVLESFQLGARLGRGRSYARNGQVLDIKIDKGKVTAKVQGSRPQPYQVAIKVKSLVEADWKTVGKVLASQAIFAAKLLGGEMPQDIETAFAEAKVSLFPGSTKDLDTDCSCPDWSNPCKHVAAVYYLIGEEFDRDPFLLFKLRGQSREELMKVLGQGGGKPEKAKTRGKQEAAAEPLPAEPNLFWNGTPLPADFFGPVECPPVAAALPKKLGNLPFWRGQELFLDALEPVYREAGRRGLEVFLSEIK